MQTKLTKDKNNPAQVQRQKQSQPTRVACIGDSITEAPQYPQELQRLLGGNYVVGNFGVCGTTVIFDSYTAYIEQPAFEAAKTFQPKMVVIMLGTNDALSGIQEGRSRFVADYLRLIEEFKALESSPKVWLVLPPPIFGDFGQSIDYVVSLVREVAEKACLSTIDVYSALANRPELFVDGVHPNEAGALVIARQIHKAIGLKNSIVL